MTEKDAPFLQSAIEGLETEQPEGPMADELAVNALSRHTGPKADPYAAERRRQEEINGRRGEDLQREQTGVPPIPAEQAELGADTSAVRSPSRRKQTVIRDRRTDDPSPRAQGPPYHRPVEENEMTDEHRAAARRNLPDIKKELARLQSPDDES